MVAIAIRVVVVFILSVTSLGAYAQTTNVVVIPMFGDDAAAKWRGAWVIGTDYKKGDLVHDLGSSYIATSDHTSDDSNDPQDTLNAWGLVAASGANGLDGNDGNDGADGAPGSVEHDTRIAQNTDDIANNQVDIAQNTANTTALQTSVDDLVAIPPLPTLIFGPINQGGFGTDMSTWPTYTQVDTVELPAGNWMVNFNFQIDSRDAIVDDKLDAPMVQCRTNFGQNDSFITNRLGGSAGIAGPVAINYNSSSATLSTLVTASSTTTLIMECTNFNDNGSFARINKPQVMALQVGTVLFANPTTYGDRDIPE